MGSPPSIPVDPTGRARARAAQSATQHRFWRPAILLLGLAISAAVAGVVHDMLGEEAAAQREIARQSLAAGLKSHVARKLDFIRTMKGLFDSSDFVNVEEFQRFARLDTDIRDRQWWISLGWAQRQSALPGASGVEPDDHFPILYVEPQTEAATDAADAGADPAERAVMERAAERHHLLASAPHMISLSGRNAMVVNIYEPVFKSGAGGTDTLQGFLIGTIALDGFINRFLGEAFVDADLSVRLYDGNTLIFSNGAAHPSGAPQKLMLGDREWRLEIDGQPQPIEAGFWLPALVFAIGVALTALLYLRLLRVDTEYQRIADEVGFATAELADANHRLAERSTALQQVADDLRRTSREAEFANAAKTVFLANMSHELRTPLNAIIGFSEMISSRALGDTSPRYFEYATDIRTSGRYLLSIIEDLLDMSRIELGQTQLKEEPSALVDVVADVIKFLALRAREKRIGLRQEGLETLPKVLLDPKAMRQSLINLLTNAVKFSPPGSEVTISGALEAGGIALSVIDHGLGIKQQDLGRIFEPFWQNEAYRAQTKEGIGLGLAITQRLIQAHGATIEVQSREGEGTTFTIHLPAKRILRAAPRLAVVGGSGSAA